MKLKTSKKSQAPECWFSALILQKTRNTPQYHLVRPVKGWVPGAKGPARANPSDQQGRCPTRPYLRRNTQVLHRFFSNVRNHRDKFRSERTRPECSTDPRGHKENPENLRQRSMAPDLLEGNFLPKSKHLLSPSLTLTSLNARPSSIFQ